MAGQLLARLLGLVGIVLGSQAPGYTYQYLQNLNGRVDELGAVVEKYDSIVESLGLTRESYLADLRAADRETTDKTADAIDDTFARYEELKAHLATLRDAGPLERPLILAQHFKRDIAESVVEEFRASLPLTAETAAYALGGGSTLWGLPAMVFGLFGGGAARERPVYR